VWDSEVKPSGGIGDHGMQWTLTVESAEDLNRDLILSNYAKISLPSADFETAGGTFGGVFTTVEGILMKIAEDLRRTMPFTGDSADGAYAMKWKENIELIEKMASSEKATFPFEVIVRDPANASFIGERRLSLIARQIRTLKQEDTTQSFKGEVGRADIDLRKENMIEDGQLQAAAFTRTAEEDDDLGINLMKTENY